MAFVLKDRVKETTSSSGTGSVTLAGPVQGYQGFSSIGDGNTTYYCIAGVAEWEVGIGTYSAGVLSRDTVLESSANNSKVAFSSGVKDVFCTYAADKSVTTDTLPIASAFNTTSPNNTVNVASLTSAVATTNGDIALVPKGTGAVLGQVPTGSVAGGDKRGTYSVDWQLQRNFAADVASGAYSVISGGFANRASGEYSVVVGGDTNVSSVLYATIGGGQNNTNSGLWATISGGAANTASNSFATVAGGASNQATSTSATVGGGSGNIASGAASTISGGSTHRANSNYAYISGGAYGTTRGIVGYHAFPACNAPVTDDTGKSQKGLLVLGAITTSATSRVLRSDTATASTTNQLILPNNSAYFVEGTVIANVTGAGNTKSWQFTAQIKRGANAASTVLTGSTVTSPYGDAGASSWTVALSADTTNGGLAVTVTGQASTTIRWVCKLETTEVSY